MIHKLLYFILALIILFAYGCESDETKAANEARIKVKNAVLQRMEMQYRKDAVLLSLKYKVNEDTVFDIIAEKDRVLLEVLDIKPENAENTLRLDSRHSRDKIAAYQEKYEIPEEIIASILIDYYAMNCKKEE